MSKVEFMKSGHFSNVFGPFSIIVELFCARFELFFDDLHPHLAAKRMDGVSTLRIIARCSRTPSAPRRWCSIEFRLLFSFSVSFSGGETSKKKSRET